VAAQQSNIAWKFLRHVRGHPNANGNITRLFNTGDSRPPASFTSMVDRRDTSAMSAVIYGREGIANCVDASQARLTGAGQLGLDFVFERHTGRDAHRVWDLIGLNALATRLGEPGVERKELGLAPEDCIAEGRTGPLRTLLVVERSGGGMPGALDDPDSVLARALMNVGEAQVSVGAAGSYGFGKAAVAQASRVRVVLAYTCFKPTGSTDVSRRFIGLAYWGMHKVAGDDFTGWALLGKDIAGGSVAALEDEEADKAASQLGIPTRRSNVDGDLGTSFLIVDPAFNASELRGAIELFWWPLLQNTRDVRLAVTITDENGDVLSPEVGPDHDLLDQFVESFLAAEAARANGEGLVGEKKVVSVGEAGITSLTVRRPDSPLNQSLVAQMRSPLMVVGYVSERGANPPIVGVFVAHEHTNENLRRVEPPEHDKWQRQNVGGLNASPADIAMARAARAEQESAVLALRAPDPEPIYGISAFSKHFPAVDVKVAKPKPPRPPSRKQRLVRVHLVHQEGANLIEVTRPTRIDRSKETLAAEGEVKFFLDPERARRVGRRHLDATITVGAQIAEDGNPHPEWWPARVSQKKRGDEPDFELISSPNAFPAKYEGRFTVGTPVYFVLTTEPYPSDWTVDLVFDCSPWDVVAPASSHEGIGGENGL